MELSSYNGWSMRIESCPEFSKQAQILKLLQFGTVMVFLDSRKLGVVVPEHLKGDCQLRLNFDYAYEVSDFRILPDRLEASLSFNRENFFCVIPFDAVYMIMCHHLQYGIYFNQSVPIEMRDMFVERAVSGQQQTYRRDSYPEENIILEKGHLRLVKS